MKELNQKLAQIQTELKAKKSSYNSFGKYYFRKAEDILEALKPFLLKHKVSEPFQNKIAMPYYSNLLMAPRNIALLKVQCLKI